MPLRYLKKALGIKEKNKVTVGTYNESSENFKIHKRVYVYNAYDALVETTQKKKITKAELNAAIEEAIGWLGQALED